jgi:hypothetical protein
MRSAILCVAGVLVGTAATASPQVTFYKDVLPVLQKNCQTCHRPGEAAPMSFLSYESTRPWAKSIKTAVLTKKMPPWFADPHYGKFANDRSLSQAETDTLVAWVDGGAKAGDAKAAPPALDWVEGWRIGKPDAVISMPIPFNVPAKGTIDYQYIVIPTGFTEDKYVQFAEARPGNRTLVHHILAFVREPGNPWLRDAQPGVPYVPAEHQPKDDGNQAAKRRPERPPEDVGINFGGDMLIGFAPGAMPQALKPGQAKLIKAGSDIVLQMHYTANGTAGTDASKVGLIFSKDKPAERVLTVNAANFMFAIPPGDAGYHVDAKLKLQEDATLVSLLPHMHYRGKSFEYRVTYPSGEKETLLSVPNYSFDWQLSYDLTKPKLLPKGTLIECSAVFDNSATNRFNPDPTKEVHFGEQTWEEMMIGFFDVTVPMNVSAADVMTPKRSGQDRAGF